MRKKNFLILLIVTIALTLLMIYVEKSEDQAEKNKVLRLGLKPEEITYLKIEKPENDIIELIKSSEEWLFKNDQIIADSKYINDLISKISETEFKDVPVEAGQSLEQFRFEKPAGQLTLMSNQNDSYTMMISSRLNFEGKNYLKLSQDEKIYTAESDVIPLILNKTIYFQNKHLFNTELEQVKKISIKSLNENFQLIEPFEKNKVLPLLTKLRNMTVQQYFKTAVKLTPPILSVAVDAGGAGGHWIMLLSLNTQDRKLYSQITDDNKSYSVEFDTSYWEYFSNLSMKQFAKDKK